jgi:hypothetical protein
VTQHGRREVIDADLSDYFNTIRRSLDEVRGSSSSRRSRSRPALQLLTAYRGSSIDPAALALSDGRQRGVLKFDGLRGTLEEWAACGARSARTAAGRWRPVRCCGKRCRCEGERRLDELG